MRTTTLTFARLATVSLIALALTGCATHSRKHNNTLIGAGLGAAGGAVLSQGNPVYTLGGAAAGGVLGHILTEDDRNYKNSSKRGRSHAAPRRPDHQWGNNRHGSRHNSSRNSRRR